MAKQKRAVGIIFRVNKETYAKPLSQQLDAHNIYQINLL